MAGVESGAVESPLDVFEVQAPLRASYDGTSCEQVVLQRNFAASYGVPYVGRSLESRRWQEYELIRGQEPTLPQKIANLPQLFSTFR